MGKASKSPPAGLLDIVVPVSDGKHKEELDILIPVSRREMMAAAATAATMGTAGIAHADNLDKAARGFNSVEQKIKGRPEGTPKKGPVRRSSQPVAPKK